MGVLLAVIGYGWAMIGLANIVVYPGWETQNEVGIVVSIIFNAVLFILPGLAVGALGGILRKKAPH